MKVLDVLNFGGLQNASVVAGFGGLNKEIVSVSVLEVAEESISTWTLENQLFITSFYAIRDNVKMQNVVVETLAKSKCCGLVICHLKYILREIDKSLLELCDNLDFPLLVADTDTSFVDILNPIFQRLSAPEKENSGCIEIREDFVDLLAGDHSVSEILKIAAYKIGYEVSFLDIAWNCLYSNKSEMEKSFENEYFRHMPKLHPDQAHYHFVDLGQSRHLIYYIRKNHRLYGAISIKCRTGITDNELLDTASSLNILCTILFNKSIHMHDLMYDYEQTFFSDLLVWNFPSAQIALNRANELGYSLSGKHHIVVIHLNDVREIQNRQESPSTIFNYLKRWFFPSIIHMVKGYAASNIVHFQRDRAIIFLDKPDSQEEIHRLCEQLLKLFQDGKIKNISIGTSRRFSQAEEIPNAYVEASELDGLGRLLLGPDRIASFHDLGMLFYLKGLKGRQDVLQLCREILSPLKQQDESRGTDFVHTAYTLLKNNLDIQRSAQMLHVHRNTLLYRKKQIQDILGYDPFIFPYSLHFILALLTLYPAQ